MDAKQLVELVQHGLEEVKGQMITVIDVQARTPMTDFMVICTGNSDRHVKALSNSVQNVVREAGVRVRSVEGEQHAQWILVDLIDVLVHIMLPDVRALYQLEKLWSANSALSAPTI